MTAPVAESVEQEGAARNPLAHYFCVRCWGTGPQDAAIALCGEKAPKRGGRGWMANDCVLCAAAWQMRPAFTCPRCGLVPR